MSLPAAIPAPVPTSPPPLAPLTPPDDAVEMQAYGQSTIVSTYGAPQAEYAAIRKACGLMDCNHRGLLEVTGKDRLSFLNNFLTNLTWSKETKLGIPAGTGTYAFLLNGKGRVVADMNVLETGEATWLETDARLVPVLREALEKYVFTEQVGFSIPAMHVISLHGPSAATVLADMTSLPAAPLHSRAGILRGVPVRLFRDDSCCVPGYHVVVAQERSLELWRALVDPHAQESNKRALRPVGWAMFNATRIEAGRPLFGIDFTADSLPAETGAFERAVSTVKGCYLGQEVVARMFARQQVARQLVGLRVADDALPIAGAHVQTEAGDIVGTVTSSTVSPVLGSACIALAMVKKGHNTLATKLIVAAEGAMRDAKVTALPFFSNAG